MTERIPGSFRDPAGFVFNRDGALFRQVNIAGRGKYDALLNSGLYDVLVRKRLLIEHEVADVPPAHPPQASLVIRPHVAPFISYPYEWAPGQLRAAAEATLEIQQLAIEHGMSLRDASAYNIQFIDGRPTLIDTLSFEPRREGSAWTAYAQFCRHFLAPLALMKHVDVRLGALLRTHIDGVPLDLASTLLPRRTRISPGLGIHLHAHASTQQRHAARQGTAQGASREVSKGALLGLTESLRATTRKLEWEPPTSAWRDYYAKSESYSEASNEAKQKIVEGMLRSLDARSLWDLGANTGHYSRLAADITGADVVAVEMDPASVEVMWRTGLETGQRRVLPILNDLSNPSPGQGWAHRERDSLLGRGPADVVLALALVHHLAIGNNVPLVSLLDWLSCLTRTVLIEWIPKDDPMVQRLLSSREDVFDEYTTEHFEQAVRKAGFTVRERVAVVDSLRTIYLLELR